MCGCLCVCVPVGTDHQEPVEVRGQSGALDTKARWDKSLGVTHTHIHTLTTVPSFVWMLRI